MMRCFHSFSNAGFLVFSIWTALLSRIGLNFPTPSSIPSISFFHCFWRTVHSPLRILQDSCYKWWKVYLLVLLPGEFWWFSLRFCSSSCPYPPFLQVCIISFTLFSVLRSLFWICFCCGWVVTLIHCLSLCTFRLSSSIILFVFLSLCSLSCISFVPFVLPIETKMLFLF